MAWVFLVEWAAFLLQNFQHLGLAKNIRHKRKVFHSHFPSVPSPLPPALGTTVLAFCPRAMSWEGQEGLVRNVGSGITSGSKSGFYCFFALWCWVADLSSLCPCKMGEFNLRRPMQGMHRQERLESQGYMATALPYLVWEKTQSRGDIYAGQPYFQEYPNFTYSY